MFLFYVVWIWWHIVRLFCFWKHEQPRFFSLQVKLSRYNTINFVHYSLNDNIELASKKWIHLRFHKSVYTVSNFMSKCQKSEIHTCVGCFHSVHKIISKYNQQCNETNAFRSGLWIYALIIIPVYRKCCQNLNQWTM